ncbi:ABC transporter substrate-binding protein [Pedococcus sp. 5OH_020]|uniref:ABC transporter substrate-binding protein n=1 Tax=Pedococcus sp. 5OH_020 TaxID=2989814 RepID=UPI0022E9F0A8|nr:ABC transporter substrate-binding protein [Pedococcus sp. 5OH_020]
MRFTLFRPSTAAKYAVVAASAALVVTTAGCSSGGESAGQGPNGKTEVTFSYLWTGPEAQALEKVIASFNASQSQVEVKGVSNPDMQKQLASMSSAKGSFDISDGFGNQVGSWASKGVLEPLDQYISDDHVDTADFVPAAMGQMKYHNKTYALPIAVHSFELLYNKKLLADAGVTPPKTMDELASAIKKLTKVGAGGNITQLGLGNPDLPTSITTLGYAFGGDWNDPSTGKPTPDKPGNVQALDFYAKNVVQAFGADKVNRFVGGFGPYMSAQDPFQTGKVAMEIDGEWRSASITSTAPTMKWGVTQIPVADPSLAGSTQLTTSTLFIPANSQHKAAAAKFLAYMVGKDGMLPFTRALGNLPARTSMLDNPIYNDLQNFKPFLDSLKSDKVHALSSAPGGSQYATDLASAIDSVNRGKASAQQALSNLATKTAKYGQ